MKVKFYTEPIKFPVDGVDVVAASSKVGIVVIYYEERLPKEAQLRAVERMKRQCIEAHFGEEGYRAADAE